jgi:uncharacterized repeat protein (TIGR03803 family)
MNAKEICNLYACGRSLIKFRLRLRVTAFAAIAATAGLAWANVATATPSESIIYTFNTTDGANPSSICQGKKGGLYGTTAAGGTNGLGTLFKLTHAGVLTTLHTFAGADGASPNSMIEGPDGDFYGTTTNGGEANRGDDF